MDAKRINRSSVDLISNLPDDILCYILSFLSTKEAAVTSVLSKRWLNLLPMVPVLDFNDSELVKLPRGTRRISSPSSLFRKFVDRLLSFRVENSLPVKGFSLKCHRKATGVTRLIRWMPTVLELGVSDLTLLISIGIYRLPFNVCMSKTLVNLRIGTRIQLVYSSSSFVSSMLKTLSLDSVAFDDQKFGYKPILSAFPSLEKLRIHEAKNWCYWSGSVSSPSLKSLTYKSDDESSAPKRCVSFDTPKLVYLDYSDVVADEYKNVKLDGLVEAKLDLHLLGNQIMRKILLNNTGSVSGDVTKLFMGIKHVKILCLSPDTLEALYYRGEAIPVFNNLTCLSLGSEKPHGSPFIFWKMMSALVLNSQNLQTLIIKGLVHYFKWEGVMSWSRLDFSWNDVFSSLSSSATKVVELIGCEGSFQEVNQIQLFLSALSNLELLKVDHKSVDNGERWRLMKELMSLSRASAKCEIQLLPCKLQATSDNVASEYKDLKLDGLFEAKLDLHLLGSQTARKKNLYMKKLSSISGDVTPLIMGIKHVKILCLSPDTLEALYYRVETIPVFNNLTCLSLGSDKSHGSSVIFWKMMSALLRNSQNLQTLIIKGLVHYFRWGELLSSRLLDFSWIDVFSSLSSSSFKVLELIGCGGSSREVKQIKLLLSVLPNLELLRIDHKSVDDGKRWRLMKELMSLSRASAKCEIQLLPCKRESAFF